MIFITILSLLVVAALGIFICLLFRKIVEPNFVNVVQSRGATKYYGANTKSGNVYMQWPSWFPIIGTQTTIIPIYNFDLSLKDYEAYDKDRVPFMVDVTAFFRINNIESAAKRISSIKVLVEQLNKIIQGAVRKVLASDVIDNIMLERAQFGKLFTDEIKEQLDEWGIESVKTMELMDIRDSKNSRVIANIMEKKTSFIEMESRVEVANNNKQANEAEIISRKEISLYNEDSEQAVGERRAEKERQVNIAKEKTQQDILLQRKETATKTMDVLEIESVRKAEIIKKQQIIEAEQEKEAKKIKADANLIVVMKEAEGIEAKGKANAEALKATELAPVQAQITLAQEIGANDSYQNYLATIEALKAYIEVGGKQAEALKTSDIKIFANGGTPSEGITNAADLFSSKGGTQISAFLQSLAQSPIGEKMFKKFGIEESYRD